MPLSRLSRMTIRIDADSIPPWSLPPLILFWCSPSGIFTMVGGTRIFRTVPLNNEGPWRSFRSILTPPCSVSSSGSMPQTQFTLWTLNSIRGRSMTERSLVTYNVLMSASLAATYHGPSWTTDWRCGPRPFLCPIVWNHSPQCWPNNFPVKILLIRCY